MSHYESTILNWGRSVEWRNPTVIGDQPRNIRRIIQLDGIGEGSRVMTIALVKKIRNPGVNIDFRASIQFSAGSVTQELVCDFVDGGLVRVPGTGVIVDALPYAPRAASMNMTDLDLSLGAIVGIGDGGTIPPSYTDRLPAVAALATSATRVPPVFARALSVYPAMNVAVDAYANIALEFVHQDPASTLIARIPGPVLAGGAASPVPANANARIVNLSAVEGLTPTLVWHLACG